MAVLIAFDTMTRWVEESGTDETVLVILCWVKLMGNNFHTCRFIWEYQPVHKVTDSI